MSSSPRFRAFASVAPGLEAALVTELAELGIRARSQGGGAAFEADLSALSAVHLHGRVVARVTVEVARSRDASLEGVARAVRAGGWRRFIAPGQPLQVRGGALGNRGRTQQILLRKVEHAIQDAVRGPRARGGRPTREPARIIVNANKTAVTVSLDASGELLHRRGWRKATAKAPVRENLAAAVLRLADWVPGQTLVDPLCGAGTFAIEAATIASGRPPGLDRTFAFERWPICDAAAVKSQRDAASRLGAADESAGIYASDRDAGAVRATRDNAKRAGVAARIDVRESAFADLEPPAARGLMVANPPYGERIGSGSLAWLAGGLRARWGGWRVALLVPPSARRVFAPLGLVDVAGFRNGGIPVRVLVGQVKG